MKAHCACCVRSNQERYDMLLKQVRAIFTITEEIWDNMYELFDEGEFAHVDNVIFSSKSFSIELDVKWIFGPLEIGHCFDEVNDLFKLKDQFTGYTPFLCVSQLLENFKLLDPVRGYKILEGWKDAFEQVHLLVGRYYAEVLEHENVRRKVGELLGLDALETRHFQLKKDFSQLDFGITIETKDDWEEKLKTTLSFFDYFCVYPCTYDFSVSNLYEDLEPITLNYTDGTLNLWDIKKDLTQEKGPLSIMNQFQLKWIPDPSAPDCIKSIDYSQHISHTFSKVGTIHLEIFYSNILTVARHYGFNLQPIFSAYGDVEIHESDEKYYITYKDSKQAYSAFRNVHLTKHQNVILVLSFQYTA